MACRNHRPKSLDDGRFLCWDFASRAGCRCPADSFPRGKHEMVKTSGLRPLIQMRLARLGWRLAGKEIQPRYSDGRVMHYGRN